MKIIKDDAAIALADSLPDAVFRVDEAGHIRYANEASESILGYRRSDLVDNYMLDLVVPEDRARTLAEARRVLEGGRRTGFENRYVHHNGAHVHLSWSAQWHATHRLRFGVARDITAMLPQCRRIDPAPFPQLDELAPHERRVLSLLLTEAAEKQIAQQLGLAVSTTHSYITSIYRKLGVRGRAGLMSLWLRRM